jgi:hypothetical protein
VLGRQRAAEIVGGMICVGVGLAGLFHGFGVLVAG